MIPIITKRHDSIEVNTPYNTKFIEALKTTVPPGKRVWSKPNWIVSKEFEYTIIGYIIMFYGCEPQIIDRQNGVEERISRTIKLEYLGRCKTKDDKPSAASAWADGSWSVLILESALRGYFEKEQSNDSEQTYYNVLGVSQESTADEIKKAFRRVSRQWHPDVCREQGAQEMFIKINEANNVLSDEIKRKKYNFMLRVMTDITPARSIQRVHNDRTNNLYGYRSPLLCGYLDVEGTKTFGRLVVDKINTWNEITNNQGRAMIVSWQMGDKQFTTLWV